MQLFPINLYATRANAKLIKVRIQHESEADAKVVTIRSDYSLRDIVFNFNQEGSEVLAIRGAGAWHSLN